MTQIKFFIILNYPDIKTIKQKQYKRKKSTVYISVSNLVMIIKYHDKISIYFHYGNLPGF